MRRFMHSGIRPRLTYANAMASIAVFVALGGGAYAAVKLPAKSVGAKQIKKGAVTGTKIARNAITGKKVKNRSLTGADINLTNLPKVPRAATADRATSAATADTATTADNVAAPEPYHAVGAPGEPPFSPGAGNLLSTFPEITLQTAGFYKDREGVVHLKGFVTTGTGEIFELPPGYRPADGKVIVLSAPCGGCTTTGGAPIPSTNVSIYGAGIQVGLDGQVTSDDSGVDVSLDGLTLRAGA